MQRRSYRVSDQSGRIDKVLAKHLTVSRNQVEKLIKEGLVEVNGKVVTKPGFRLNAGDEIIYRFKEAEQSKPKSIEFEVPILYEDEHLLVVNKPAGLVVHPAPSVKGPTLVDWLKHKGVRLSTISGEERHGIVHRIDKETTGALVVAKTNAVHENLSYQLQSKTMGRYYLALIDHPLKDDCVIEAPIARNPKNRLKMAVVEGGKEAKSAFVKLAQSTQNTELIAVKLYTGRTHQIRVHLSRLGRHILGDDLYGFKSKGGKIPRVYLHAFLLYLTHPVSQKPLSVKAPLFEDMRVYLERHFDPKEIDAILKKDSFIERFGFA